MIDAHFTKKIFIKLLKVIAWTFSSILVILLAFILALRIPSIQNTLTQKVITFLEQKIKTNVDLKSIYVSFPTKIVLEGLLVEDQHKDTLLFAGMLKVDTYLWGLTQNKIELNSVSLSNCQASVHRAATDSTFNYDYIINAFSPPKPAKEPDTTKSTWTFSLADIILSDVKARYNDDVDGNDIALTIGSLTLSLNEFNLDKLIFKAENLSLSNSFASISQYKNDTLLQESGLDTIRQLLPTLAIEEVSVQNTKVRYNQIALKQFLHTDIGEFEAEINTIDLNKQVIDVSEIKVSKSFLSLQSRSGTQKKTTTKSDTSSSSLTLDFPWHITCKKLDLAGNTVQYYDFGKERIATPLDFNHLWIMGLTTSAQDIDLNKNTATFHLKNLTLREKNGFAIQSFSMEAALTSNELTLQSFFLQSGVSKIDMNGKISFSSLQNLSRDYDQAKVNFNMNKSIIGVEDILIFFPALLDSLPIRLPPSTRIALNTTVKGFINDATVQTLTVRTLDSTWLELQGNIKGLPDVDHSVMNVRIQKFYTTQNDVHQIIPDSLLNGIQIPTWIELKGSGKGPLKAPTLQLLLTSSAGAVEANGGINFISKIQYDIHVNTKDLHLGKILKQDSTIGTLDMQASIKGAGLTMEDLDAVFSATIVKFQYSQYDYKDFKISGSMKKYLFSGDATLADKNLDFTLKGDMDYQTDMPLYKFTADVKNIDFKELHLSERTLKARGILDIKMNTADFKVLNGNIDLRKVAVYNGQALYMVDSLLFASIDQEGESSISIRSDILSGEFKGSFNIFQLPGVMRKHIDQYFSLHDSTLATAHEPQNFSFDLTLKNTDLITEVLIPELEPFVPGVIKGEFDSELNKLDIHVALSTLKYNTVGMDSLNFTVTSDKKSLNYKLALKNILIDTLHIPELQLGGEIGNDSLRTRLVVLDSLGERIYVLGGVIKSESKNYRFNFMPNEVMLNYDRWTVAIDNYLQFGMQGLVAHNFSLSKQSEKIALTTSSKDSVVSLEFNALQLANITKIVTGVLPASGKLTGNLKFTTSGDGDFNSKLHIDDLTILEKPWGNVNFTMSHRQAQNRYTMDLKVTGEKTNLTANGFYIPGERSSDFDFSVKLAPLDIQLIEPFSGGQLTNVTGLLSGGLKLTGSTLKPVIRGALTFNETSFTVKYVNSRYVLQNEEIEFNEKGISFTNVNIKDEKNNDAEITGVIETAAYKDFDLNLRVTTKNFNILNTTETENDLYFGKVNINATARVRGNFKQPHISLNLGLTNGSTFTYIVPQAERMVVEQKGIVQFVDKDAVNDPFLASVQLEDTVQSVFKGIDLTANLDLNDKAILNIVIDPVTGDKLSVQGNSTLTLVIDASGNMDLTGRYEITKGSYNFSFYKLVKRKFDIVRGSTITWAGNPLNASLDIRASNTVETSPMDLVSNQLTTTDQRLRQRLPFLVYLNIKGQLLTPQISFELDMPENHRNAFGGAIYAKIQDINTKESDLNKQVFALLILKRFISDNPLESQAGSDLNNTARMSVSRLLSEQFNRLTENIKGVQLNVDLKSYDDYSTGQAQGQTKVQLGVSKSLFNDRLVVKLSGNLDIEGETSSQEDVTDYIGDLALEYKLTPDGRFRVTGFRNSNYDMINGELTETGAGLIYIKDYNTLRELFRANEKEK